MTSFPLILFIIIFFIKTYYIFFLFLKISTSIFILRIIISFGFLTLFILNDNNLETFIKYCPFNYLKTDYYLLFPNLNYNNIININSELKEKCINKRCYKFQDNEFICNYNSEKILGKDKIICQIINLEEYMDYSGSNIIYSYINTCNSFTNFYKCYSKIKLKKYSIKYNYICPENYKGFSTLEIIITVFNYLLPVIIYIMQFISYKKILKAIVTLEIQRHNDTNTNKTIDSSNKGKNKSSFKKEKTEFLILDNICNNGDNIIQILAKCKNIRKKKRIKIFRPDIVKIYQNTEKNINKDDFDYYSGNKSFDKNFNSNNNNKINNCRLLTEVDKKQKEEKEDKKETKENNIVNCIVIKK